MTASTLPTQQDVPWCQTSEPEPVLVACYWFIHCIWVINIALGTYGIYKICQMRHKINIFSILYIILSFLWFISPPGVAFGFQSGIHKCPIDLYFFIALLYLISICLHTIALHTKGWECWYNDFAAWEGTVMSGVTPYLYGLAVLYFFFLFRLKKVFDTTGLRINRIIMSILYLSGIAQLILPALVTYYFMVAWDDEPRKWAVRYFNAHSAINIFSLLFILVLFIRKILFLSHIQKNGSHHVQNESNTDAEKEKNNSKMIDTVEIHKRMVEAELLNLTIRYLVCALFAFSSGAIVAFIGLLRSEVNGLTSNLPLRGVHITSYILDEATNLMCLLLQFPFGKELYGKCCFRFDKCVKSLFVKALNIRTKTISKPARNGTVQMEMSI